MVTWKELIDKCAGEDVILACTLSEEDLAAWFDCDYGTIQGKPFTAWSENYVYFPVMRDGAEWVGRVPRNPCAEATKHKG